MNNVKYILPVIVLFTSFSFSDIIVYEEKTPDGWAEVKKLKDVAFIGVSKEGVIYIQTNEDLFGFLGLYKEETIPCEYVSYILDDNNEKVNFSCTQYWYTNPKNKINKNDINSVNSAGANDTPNYISAGLVITASGILGIINTNSTCQDCETFDDYDDFISKSKNRVNIQYALLTFGGIMIVRETIKAMNPKKKKKERLADKLKRLERKIEKSN